MKGASRVERGLANEVYRRSILQRSAFPCPAFIEFLQDSIGFRGIHVIVRQHGWSDELAARLILIDTGTIGGLQFIGHFVKWRLAQKHNYQPCSSFR